MDCQNASETRLNFIIFFIAGCLYVGLRIYYLDTGSLWLDEIFTVSVVRLGWQEMFATLTRDGVHPPLFYILLKIWLIFSSSIWWLKLFPVLISFLTVVPFYFLCRQFNFNFQLTSLAILCIAVNGYFLEYAGDLRMYGQLQLLAITSIYFFVQKLKLEESPRHSLILLIVNLLLVYTHYFGWLIVTLEWFYLLIWRRDLIISFTKNCLAVGLIFLPWALAVIRAALRNETTGNLKWQFSPDLTDFVYFYGLLSGEVALRHITPIGLLIFFVPITLWSWKIYRIGKTDETWRLLLYFAFLPVLLIFWLSYLLPKPIWEGRYLIIAAIPFIILALKSASEISHPLLRRVSIGLILMWSIFAGLFQFTLPPKKINWNEIALQARRSPDMKIYALEDWAAAPLQFYLEKNGKNELPVVKVKNLSEISETNFELITRDTSWRDILTPAEILTLRGCQINMEKKFAASTHSVTLFRADNCPPVQRLNK